MVANPLSSVVKSDDGDGRDMGHNLVHHINGPSRTENQGPTDSHAISHVEPDEKGLVQKAGASQEVSDIGWEHGSGEIGERIVPGLLNEDLWMLIRRFDKVCDSGAAVDWALLTSTATVLCQICAGYSNAETRPCSIRR